LKAAIDLLFPPACLVCHRRIASATDVLCESCLEKISLVPDDYCKKCGSALYDGLCENCFDHEFSFDMSRSVFKYGDVIRDLVHQLKYEGRRSPVRILGKGMREFAKDNEDYQGFDLVTAVPLHRVRQRERGYNQSRLLGQELAQELGLPYREIVRRRYYTQSQTNLDRFQRRANLRDAFKVKRSAALSGKNIILVDDVFTTGTTASELAKTLKAGGANRVTVLTACRAG